MNDNTCKNCLFWGYDRKNTCGLEGGHLPANAAFHIEATADDDSGLETFLITGPDFGCVHFKGKENA